MVLMHGWYDRMFSEEGVWLVLPCSEYGFPIVRCVIMWRKQRFRQMHYYWVCYLTGYLWGIP